MNVFDQPDNFPPVFLHAWEYLKINGPTHREELEKMLAPSSFATTAHANVKSTLGLGIRTRVFNSDSDVLTNSDQTNSQNDFNGFRRVVRDIFFNQKLNNHSELKNQKGNIQLATAWFYSFPFDETPGTWSQAEDQLPKDFSSEHTHWPIQNKTQWAGFERWMRFLGLGIQGIGRGDSIILLPCVKESVWDVLEDLPNDSRTPIKNVIDLLIARLPSLPGGIVFNELAPNVSNRVMNRNTALIAQALRNAATEKIVTLETGVDVANREVFATDAGDFNFDFIVKGKRR
jgi:hypothetical protein